MLERPRINPRFAELDRIDRQRLSTGDVLARRDPTAIAWTAVKGPEAKRTWRGEERVEIRDLSLKVDWPTGPTTKYEGTLFLIQDCEDVLVEDVAIVHTNADYRGQHSFLIESCGTVTFRNVYSAGAAARYHIRLEGCEEYAFERIEISGWDYGKAGVRCGAGIFVNNGITKPDGSIHVYSKNRRELRWGVIRDSWFHDYLVQDEGEWRNQDGIGFHAPADGFIFNCVFDRWQAGDGAIDDSHRRHDPAYRNKVHRIERCLFRDCNLVKTDGAKGSPDCVVVWANNVYRNTWLADYHKGWHNWHIHETHVWTEPMPVFVKNWGIQDGLTIFANGLLAAPAGVERVYWQSGKAPEHGYRQFLADTMWYCLREPRSWLWGVGKDIPDRAAWLAEGRERNCVVAPDGVVFADAAGDDYRPTVSSAVCGRGSDRFLVPSDAALRVAVDFNGVRRPDTPTPGAFEPAP